MVPLKIETEYIPQEIDLEWMMSQCIYITCGKG